MSLKPTIAELAERLTFRGINPEPPASSLPILANEQQQFIDSWLKLVNHEDPADAKFIEQLYKYRIGSLQEFSIGNYNENRVKGALIEMKQDGVITDFFSHAKKPERIFSTDRMVQRSWHDKNIAGMNDQQIERGTNLSNDSLKIDALICKETDDQTVYFPLQIKSERYNGSRRNSHLLLSGSQINKLRELFPGKIPMEMIQPVPGKNNFLLPIHYEYAITHKAASTNKSAIKQYISMMLKDPSKTFQSRIELPQLKGFELLKTLIESNLLTIGHKTLTSRG
jgi:hypothetical protein